MNKNWLLSVLTVVMVFSLKAGELTFQSEVYHDRLEDYRTTAIANFHESVIPIQAYLGVPVDANTLQEIIEGIPTNGEFDFKLVQLVRVLFLSHGEYEHLILPAIDTLPMWLTPHESTRVYWSENHITMWLSSAWLLKEKYGIDRDSELRKKLLHCLDLKIRYGYYEFFSSVYLPYTLSGLLNLVDFAQDEEIKQKATVAADRLLRDILLLVNDKGVFFPASARNYRSKYESAYRQNHSHLIYLLTGLGEKPDQSSHAGAFLATSSFDVQHAAESWSSKENKLMHIGHSISEIHQVHKDLLPADQTIFQWSAGAFFHPETALQTARLLSDYNLWNHGEFKDFKDFKNIPVGLAPVLAKLASSISYSSVNTQADIAIFKNKGVTLSSLQNFWKGRAGYQQWPWSANIDNIAVSTQSGNANQSLGSNSIYSNSNLPYVQQKENMALIMYRPKKSLKLLGREKHDVILFWEDENFDEYREEGKWIIGRKGDSYIAVLRHCMDIVNGAYACQDQDGQLWACVVGNHEMYGSFEAFKDIIRHAKYQEKWVYVFNKVEWHYYGMVEVDGVKLEYNWVENLTGKPDDAHTEPLVTSVEKHLSDGIIQLYPNPVDDVLKVNFNTVKPLENIRISIIALTGGIVFSREVHRPVGTVELPMRHLAAGAYLLSIETSDEILTKKIIVK